MKSIQTAAPGAPLVEVQLETPTPSGTEVLIRTVAVGVCHSDVHLHDAVIDLGDGQQATAGFPGMTLGHEIFGEVVALGPDASGVSIGDRRVVYPWIGCDDCRVCARGDSHLCGSPRTLGTRQPGGFGDHVVVPHARYLHDKGDADDALSCTYACSGLTAYSALQKVGPLGAGDEVVIIGVGGVGMNAVRIARAVFDIQPIVVDIDDRKLRAASEFGVQHVFNSKHDAAAEQIRKLTDGGVRVVIDFVGSESSSQFALGLLCKGGKLILVGLFGGGFKMPLPLFPLQARTVEGSYVGSPAQMDELMALVRAGKIPPIAIEEREASAEAATRTLADLVAGEVAGRVVLMYGS